MKRIPDLEDIMREVKQKEWRRKERLAQMGRNEFKKKGKKFNGH